MAAVGTGRLIALVGLVAAASLACSGGSSATGPASGSSAQLALPAASGSSIAGGMHFTLASVGGRPVAWGGNSSGELGDGSTTQRPTPVEVVGLPAPIVALASGTSHSLVLTTQGTVYSWGRNA